LSPIKTQVAGANARTGVKIDTCGMETKTNAEAKGSVVAIKFAYARYVRGLSDDELMERVEGAFRKELTGLFSQSCMCGVDGGSGKTTLMVETFALGSDCQSCFAKRSTQVIRFEGYKFGITIRTKVTAIGTDDVGN
jgi:hypothetical protein